MRCAACSFENPEGFRFCGSCGSALDTDHLGGERRRVTVAFADLVGYSTLAERIDAEELQELITHTFAELRAEVEAREGRVEKFIGDAVVATFGVSPAHEDDPVRAVDAAIAMLEAVQRRTDPAGKALNLRIGVNSGLVVTHPVDGSGTGVLGDAVNVAARLQEAAGPGQVLLAEPVWRRIQSNYECEHVGPLKVKGREQTVDAYRLIGPRTATQSRRQAPLVGRGHELELLELLWTSAAKGNTHVVSVVGEPGVGKTRLLSELPTRQDAADFRITCTSGRAFGAFIDLMGAVLGDVPETLDEFKQRAVALGLGEDAAVLAAALLGLADAPATVAMADQGQRRQVFAGVWQLLLAAPGDRPAMIVIDDLHWADRSSIELLEFVLERLEGPFMVVLAYRPGFEHVEQTALRASHTSIRLERLSKEESLALARGYLGADELPADLERLVATRAEGNPFFIEELLQALLDFACLTVQDGVATLERVAIAIPESVEGTILARVDRLGADDRELLQWAAVTGDPFTSEVIAAVLDDGDREPVDQRLQSLRRAQLLVSVGPDRWTFKHALIREVVYGTLLMSQRRELHGRVAQALERIGGDDPAVLEVLAEQYSKADAPDKARHFALAAGDLAAERMGFVEATARYETALRLWDRDAGSERPAVLMRLGRAALLAGRPTGARTALIEAAAGWRNAGDAPRQGEAMALLGRAHWEAGDADRARAALEEAVDLLEPLGPSSELVQALVWSSTFTMLDGHREEALAAAQRGLELAERLGLDVARSHLLNNLGACEVDGGNPAGADRQRRALELGETTGDPEAVGRAYVNLSSTLAGLRNLTESLAVSQRGREVMRGLGSPAFEWFIAANEGWVLAELGRFDEAEALCREIIADQRAVVGVAGFVNAGNALAWLLTARGRYGEARALLDDVVPEARRVGGPLLFAHVLTVEAELEEARGNVAAARQAAAEAVDVVAADFSPVFAAPVVPAAVRLTPSETSRALVDKLRPHVAVPAFAAPVAEADGWLGGDAAQSARAADLHQSFGAVCDETRCRLNAGQRQRARDIIEGYGLEAGPLGRRWRETKAGVAT
jgi:adenylate cyclase